MTEAGADAVGANCGSVDPLEMAELVAMMRDATTLPIIAQPNAGKGRMVDGDLVFDLSPADFAAGMQACACSPEPASSAAAAARLRRTSRPPSGS